MPPFKYIKIKQIKLKVDNMAETNPFLNPKLENKADMIWIGFYVILLVIAMTTSIINPSAGWGQIYVIMGLITISLICLSFTKSNLPIAKVVYGRVTTDKAFWIAVGLGILMGMIVISQGISSMKALTPLLTAPLSIFPNLTPDALLVSLFLMTVIVVEFEESWRASVMVPTMFSWMTKAGIGLAMIIFSILVYFMWGLPYISLGMALIGILLFFQKRLFDATNSPILRHIFAVLIAAIFFASLHVSAYAASVGAYQTAYNMTCSTAQDCYESLLLGALIFAVLGDMLNWFSGSAIPSRIGHAINNATQNIILINAMAVAAGSPLRVGFEYAVAVVVVYVAILYLIRRATDRGWAATDRVSG